MDKISAKLSVLAVLLIAASCITLPKTFASATPGEYWSDCLLSGNTCAPGSICLPASSDSGVCAPTNLFSQVSSRCQSHGDCAKVEVASYCIRVIDGPYGLCSKSIKP